MTKLTELKTAPRIYIACLASYNNGILYGEWIVPAMDKDKLYKQIDIIIKSSSMTNAEEWAVHDYDNFPNLGEYPQVEDIILIQEAITEHGADLVNAFLTDYQIEDLDRIDEAFCGEWDSFQDFADDMANSIMEIPSHIEPYFDYKNYAYNLKADYSEIKSNHYTVFIFNNNF
tara:strand:- start:532 stop:1050 length:519 start_codon:yes stop_codon:yes gene_type:complete